MKKIFVTGGTGFIGKRIVTRLNNVPETMIYVLSRKYHDDYDRVKYIKGDLYNEIFLRRILSEIRPDTLLHLAWDVKNSNYVSSDRNYNWIKWSESLARIFLDNGGKNIIASGTCFEYDIRRREQHEEEELSIPNTVYGKCKLMTKEKLENICNAYGARFVWGRIFYPYGEGEDSRKLISSAICAYKQGRDFISATPNDVIDYIYIDDIVKIFYELLFNVEINSVINIGTGVGTPIKQILSFINESKYDCDLFSESNAKGRVIIANSRKLRKYFHEDFVTIENGIKKMKQSYGFDQ